MDNRRTTAAVASGAVALALLGGAIAWQVSDRGEGTAAGTQTSTAATSGAATPTSSRPTVTSTASRPTATSATSATSPAATTTTTVTSTTSATSTPSSSPEEPGICSSSEVTSLIQRPEALPATTREVAQEIKENAQDCRTDLLVKRASVDNTQLSFGAIPPEEAWALPETGEKPYLMTTTALGMPWGKETTNEGTFYVWPRVSTNEFMDDDTAWQEVVDGGLLTQADAAEMRETFRTYVGYRIGIAEDGRWMFALAGD